MKVNKLPTLPVGQQVVITAVAHPDFEHHARMIGRRGRVVARPTNRGNVYRLLLDDGTTWFEEKGNVSALT